MLAFVIEADTFMRNMVRVLVGTMLEGVSPEAFADSWRAGRAARRGRPRPPTGFTWSRCATE